MQDVIKDNGSQGGGEYDVLSMEVDRMESTADCLDISIRFQCLEWKFLNLS